MGKAQRNLLWAVAMVMIVSTILGACTPQPENCNHQWKPADCFLPSTCTLCGITRGAPYGHTTKVGTCERCGENFGIWSSQNVVNAFGEPTGDLKIVSAIRFEGEYDDKTQSRVPLTADFSVEKSEKKLRIHVTLYKNGTDPVENNTGSTQYYMVLVSPKGGSDMKLRGGMRPGSSELIIEYWPGESSVEDVLEAMCGESEYLDVLISEEGDSPVLYQFDVYTSNFREAYDLFSEGKTSEDARP